MNQNVYWDFKLIKTNKTTLALYVYLMSDHPEPSQVILNGLFSSHTDKTSQLG